MKKPCGDCQIYDTCRLKLKDDPKLTHCGVRVSYKNKGFKSVGKA